MAFKFNMTCFVDMAYSLSMDPLLWDHQTIIIPITTITTLANQLITSHTIKHLTRNLFTTYSTYPIYNTWPFIDSQQRKQNITIDTFY